MISIFISSIALLVSFGTMWVLYKNRIETNRPIVTVLLESDAGDVSPLTIKVYNTGSTPALDVVLEADKEDLDKIVLENAPEILKKDIYKCFAPENTIPVLHNDSYVENAFGLLSNNEDNVLKLFSKLPITIRYKNLYGHIFIQKQILIMKTMNSFAGSAWRKRK